MQWQSQQKQQKQTSKSIRHVGCRSNLHSGWHDGQWQEWVINEGRVLVKCDWCAMTSRRHIENDGSSNLRNKLESNRWHWRHRNILMSSSAQPFFDSTWHHIGNDIRSLDSIYTLSDSFSVQTSLPLLFMFHYHTAPHCVDTVWPLSRRNTQQPGLVSRV